MGCIERFMRKKRKVEVSKETALNQEMLARIDSVPHMKSAYAELGISEYFGSEHNPRILEYQLATDYAASDDETPWCSSYVNWICALHDFKMTGKVNAQSWLDVGYDLEDIFAFGAICILWRESPTSWKGHVGFIIKDDDTHVWLLGGNQGDSVSVAKYPKSRVLGIRGPEKA